LHPQHKGWFRHSFEEHQPGTLIQCPLFFKGDAEGLPAVFVGVTVTGYRVDFAFRGFNRRLAFLPTAHSYPLDRFPGKMLDTAKLLVGGGFAP
jgi:hypothetical protein